MRESLIDVSCQTKKEIKAASNVGVTKEDHGNVNLDDNDDTSPQQGSNLGTYNCGVDDANFGYETIDGDSTVKLSKKDRLLSLSPENEPGKGKIRFKMTDICYGYLYISIYYSNCYF